jgi:hypothetical protein
VAITAMAHNQVRLTPQARTSLLHNETTAMATTKQVPKRIDGAWRAFHVWDKGMGTGFEAGIMRT